MNADDAFKKLDANSDGSISKDEFTKGIDQLRTRFASMGRPERAALGARGPGAAGLRGPQALAERFKRLDKNADGKLSKDEVPAAVWERISQADANNDGAVTKEEAENHFKQRLGLPKPEKSKPKPDTSKPKPEKK